MRADAPVDSLMAMQADVKASKDLSGGKGARHRCFAEQRVALMKPVFSQRTIQSVTTRKQATVHGVKIVGVLSELALAV